MTHTSDPSGLVEHLFRHQAGRLVARLTRLFGPANVSLAEETVQEALIRALQTWPYQGVPENAAGWLFRVAHNLAVDAVRRDRAALQQLARDATIDLAGKIPHGSGQTYARELALAADHAAYHVGQLVLVRQALGDWK